MQPCGYAIEHTADSSTVRLSEGGESKLFAKGVHALYLINAQNYKKNCICQKKVVTLRVFYVNYEF